MSPHLDGPTPLEVLRSGKRAYRNPWGTGANRAVDHRTVWTDGQRAAWSLRASLALPVPATVSWDLDVPPGGVLTFGAAVGARVGSDSPVLLLATVTPEGGEPTRIWSRLEARPPRLQRLKSWTEHALPLADWAGQRVTLTLGAQRTTAGRGYRHTAFFGEPSITVRARDVVTRQAAERATGLDLAYNVLLIIVDAQRADSIGAVREEAERPPLFPAMERLAAEGVTFKQAFSVGNQTRLSTFAFLTSQYPGYGRYHHARWNYSPAQKAAFYNGDPPLLPRLLRLLGYRTVGVANNLFVFGNMQLSLDAGFDRYIDHRHMTRDTAWITESAVSWLRDHASERWFMMLNYNGPHQPYQPPEESFERFRAALAETGDAWGGFSVPYLGEVKWSDENIAQVLSALDELDLTRRTLVVLTSDHGEIMDARHQCWNRNWKSKCLHNHGKTLFDEELHVPWVMRLPGRIPAGSALDSPASHLDLGPTILGMIGAQPTADQLGRDLSGAVRAQREPEPVPVLAEARLSKALRWQTMKYIIHDARERMDFESPTLYDRRRTLEEVYDLAVDPDETQNLALELGNPRVAALREQLAALEAGLRERRDLSPQGGEAAEPPPAPVAAAPTPPERPQTNPTPPTAPQPAATREPSAQAAAVHNTLMARGAAPGGRVTGRITTMDRFVRLDRLGDDAENACQLADERTIQVDMDGTDRGDVGIRFQTEDENARLTFELAYEGSPIGASRFYVGPYGLKLFNNPLIIGDPSQYRLAQAPQGGPIAAPDVPPGVFFWRAGGGATGGGGGSVNLESADNLDSEVRSMMDQWGYTGK